MKDQFGRDIHYLRISVTDRCNLRCRYCTPPGGSDRRGVLSLEEIVETAREAAALGAGTKVCFLDAPMEELLRRLGRRAAQGQGDVFADITEADMREWAGLFQPPEGPWRHVRF